MNTLGKSSSVRLLAFFGGLLAFLLVQAAAGAAQLKGTATYRERIAMTPDAVFEAMLQDASMGDAPAVVVGSVCIDKPDQVLIRFEIPFDPALNNKTKRIAGSGGCNRFTGTYQQNGDRLTFGKMAITFMACPEGMETERDFVTALEQVRSWKILGEHLELFDGNGAFLARFEAGAPK